MRTKERLDFLFQELDYKPENGLVRDGDEDISAFQKYFYEHVKEKLGVDAVYFTQSPGNGTARIPTIYFSAVETYDAEKIAELHRIAWNLGQAPLLFVVMPDNLLIFNNYKAPEKIDEKVDSSKALIENIDLIIMLETERQSLHKYHRTQLESGEYWRKNVARFKHTERVDVTLIGNLQKIREVLLAKLESSRIVHSLLGRAILIKYLEDRSDSKGQSVFPNDFFEKYKSGAKSFADVLGSKSATYTLFEFLSEKFNGDLFPLCENEKNIVMQEHLDVLRDFLIGKVRLNDQQLALWPLYTFNAIPIQLISSIYEMFFHLEIEEGKMRRNTAKSKGKKGTYYTPYHLVELLLDEIFPWEGDFKPIRILDPSCGSGIFLVEAFRRLVGRWLFSNPNVELTTVQLKSLVENHIYGVDSNSEALRVASFSLCLTMCDYLDSEKIWNELRFPALRKNNLIASDFFSNNMIFNNERFDVIVGNPPWESSLTNHACDYLRTNKFPCGDNQIAQAFAWKTAELSKDNGSICLLMPSKGLLFNRSATNSAFRRAFFSKYAVSTLLNLSVFRKVLFANASGPSTAVFFKPRKPSISDPILYCSPKPKYTVEDQRYFVIEPVDICRIPRDLVGDDLIWKVAMWGGPRDLDLVNKLRKHPSLDEVIEKLDMVSGEGYIVASKKVECLDFLGMPDIGTEKIQRYDIKEDMIPVCDKVRFHRVVKKNRDIFRAPHLVIKQSARDGEFCSAYLDYDAVFNHSVFGLHGDPQVLKYISLLMNSKIFSYFALMTSRRWLIERDELEAAEIREFPIPLEMWNEEFAMGVEELYENVRNDPQRFQIEVEKFAKGAFDLSEGEVHLITDAMDMIFSHFQKKSNSKAAQRPQNEQLDVYKRTLSNTLEASFGRKGSFQVDIYSADSPLTVAKLNINHREKSEGAQFSSNDILNNLLTDLDELLYLQRSQGVFVRRNVRIYEKDTIFIVKPNQNMYWSYSSACRDADDMYADIMRTWRQMQ